MVQYSSFTSAASELNVSSSAVSIAIADVEQYLSLRIRERGRAGFSVTTDGREVYRSTCQLFSAQDEFRIQINAIHFNLKSELNIGITDNLVTIPKMLITSSLREINMLGPDVQINIQMIPPNEIISGVLVKVLRARTLAVLRHDSELFPSILKQYNGVLPAYDQTSEVKALHHELQPSASARTAKG